MCHVVITRTFKTKELSRSFDMAMYEIIGKIDASSLFVDHLDHNLRQGRIAIKGC